MTKTIQLILCFFIITSGSVLAQKTLTPQVNNSDFELWDNLGAANEEPGEWNSFKTASGPLVAYLSQQVKRSTQIRPGSSGNYSAVIWSKMTLSIVANANLTTGQINAGSATPSDPNNYNISHPSQPAFSEALGAQPDSIAVWIKFKPSNTTGLDSGRIRATIHDNFEVKDPADAVSLTHIVGIAFKNFASTGNQWTRLSIPFNYTGPASSPDYILISMTTNKTPGGGSANDSLWIDDMSLIYNDASVNQTNLSENFSIRTDENDIIIGFSFLKPTLSKTEIYDMGGQLVYTNQSRITSGQEKVSVKRFTKGVYLIHIITETGQQFSQKIAVM